MKMIVNKGGMAESKKTVVDDLIALLAPPAKTGPSRGTTGLTALHTLIPARWGVPTEGVPEVMWALVRRAVLTTDGTPPTSDNPLLCARLLLGLGSDLPQTLTDLVPGTTQTFVDVLRSARFQLAKPDMMTSGHRQVMAAASRTRQHNRTNYSGNGRGTRWVAEGLLDALIDLTDDDQLGAELLADWTRRRPPAQPSRGLEPIDERFHEAEPVAAQVHEFQPASQLPAESQPDVDEGAIARSLKWNRLRTVLVTLASFAAVSTIGWITGLYLFSMKDREFDRLIGAGLLSAAAGLVGLACLAVFLYFNSPTRPPSRRLQVTTATLLVAAVTVMALTGMHASSLFPLRQPRILYKQIPLFASIAGTNDSAGQSGGTTEISANIGDQVSFSIAYANQNPSSSGQWAVNLKVRPTWSESASTPTIIGEVFGDNVVMAKPMLIVHLPPHSSLDWKSTAEWRHTPDGSTTTAVDRLEPDVTGTYFVGDVSPDDQKEASGSLEFSGRVVSNP